MKKIICILFFATIYYCGEVYAQPIRAGMMYNSVFRKYEPSHKIAPTLNKPIKSKPIKLQDPIRIIDTTRQLVIYNSYNYIQPAFVKVGEPVFVTNSYGMPELNNLSAKVDAIYKQQDYNTKATVKIISGIACEVIAVGLVGFANIPTYKSVPNATKNILVYNHTEYKLVSLSEDAIPDSKCGNRLPSPPEVVNNTTIINNYTTIVNPGYELIPIEKYTSLSYTDNNNTIEKQDRNKVVYYISAGGITIVGIILEISGIRDIKKGKSSLFVGGSSIGISANF
jgi:hypothetical protein